MISRLSLEQAKEILHEGRLGRLGCVADGGPYVIPVNYLFDEESIYIHSLPGRKIEALRTNPRACLQVDQIKDEFQWRSAIAYGRYEEIADPAEREQALQKLLVCFPHFTPVESAMAQAEGVPRTVIFRIRIDEITGVAEEW